MKIGYYSPLSVQHCHESFICELKGSSMSLFVQRTKPLAFKTIEESFWDKDRENNNAMIRECKILNDITT
jgi:hypothetical protein